MCLVVTLFEALKELETEHGMANIASSLAEIAKDHEGNLCDENPTVAREWRMVAAGFMGASNHLREFLK